MSTIKIAMSEITTSVLEANWDLDISNAQMIKNIGSALGFSQSEVETNPKLQSAIWQAVKTKQARTNNTTTANRSGGYNGSYSLNTTALVSTNESTPTSQTNESNTSSEGTSNFVINLLVEGENLEISGLDLYDVLEKVKAVMKAKSLSNVAIHNSNNAIVNPMELTNGASYKMIRPLSAA